MGINLFHRYEMMYGIPPFYNQNQNMMFQLIRDSEVRFPVKPETSPEAKDLILKVLRNIISNNNLDKKKKSFLSKIK